MELCVESTAGKEEEAHRMGGWALRKGNESKHVKSSAPKCMKNYMPLNVT